MALGSTQPLTEMSTRSISWGQRRQVLKADNLPPSCAVVTKCGNLNFLEPFGALRACNGTAFFCVVCISLLFLYRFVYCFSFCAVCLLFFLQVYRPLPPGGNPIIVNKYHICHIVSYHTRNYSKLWTHLQLAPGLKMN